MASRVEVEVVAPELGYVDEPVDVELVERDENAEARHAADRSAEGLADLVLHEVALQPVLDVARCLVGAALGLRAMRAELGPGRSGRPVLRLREHGLDRAMHEQIGVAADRRREMRVRLVGKSEVPDVVGPVPCLLQRAQQHRLQQRIVGAVLDADQELRVVGRGRAVAAGKGQRAAREEVAQRGELLRRRSLVHSVKRGVAVGLEIACGADVRCEHAFLYQPVRVVAHDRHDGDDLAVNVELELHLDAVEVNRATRLPCLLQRVIERIEILELRQAAP